MNRSSPLMLLEDIAHKTQLPDLGVIDNKQPYFSLNKNKKTKMIYLGKLREARAWEYSENHKMLLDIVEEMTTLNMELLKAKACL